MNLRDTDITDLRFRKNLNTGITALILLIVLSQAAEPMYGYQIAKIIIKEGPHLMKQGTLYPVLRTLESDGLLESEVEESISGPPRRYYRITEDGRDTLKRWLRIWQQTKTLIDNITDGGV